MVQQEETGQGLPGSMYFWECILVTRGHSRSPQNPSLELANPGLPFQLTGSGNSVKATDSLTMVVVRVRRGNYVRGS